MDSISQAALGAALGGAVAGRTLGRTALLGGAVLGTLPDLDVVLDYGTAVANFSQHRGFSHSLFVLAPLALLLALALHRWRPELSQRRWFAFTGLILVTHPLLDALTTYGTQLWWPIGTPVSVGSMFIIDPLYTLPLLAGLAFMLWRTANTRPVVLALAFSTAYLGWSLAAQQMIHQRVEPALAEEGAANAPRLVQPMPFTTALWRVTVIHDDERLEIVTGFFDGNQPLEIERFPHDRELERSALRLPEGQRLDWFTRGFLAYEEKDDQLLATDIRLGLPGAHPFTFILAERQQDADGALQWQAIPSGRTSRPAVDTAAFGRLWDRIIGVTPVLCLATLETPPTGQSCS